jgi:hypothetical protein
LPLVIFFFTYYLKFMENKNTEAESHASPFPVEYAEFGGLVTPPMHPQIKTNEFTKLKVRPFGTLIITDHDGFVQGCVLGETGEGGALAKHLRDASNEGCPGVSKINNSLTPLGQDMYLVTRDFVLGSMTLIWNWENVDTLAKVLPLECKCTFVVNF